MALITYKRGRFKKDGWKAIAVAACAGDGIVALTDFQKEVLSDTADEMSTRLGFEAIDIYEKGNEPEGEEKIDISEFDAKSISAYVGKLYENYRSPK